MSHVVDSVIQGGKILCANIIMSNNNYTLMRLVTPYMDPKTLVRFAATSRNARTMSSPKQKEYALIKRIVSRRQAIKKHFENRRPATAARSGFKGRLTQYLVNAKMAAHARSQMTPEAVLRSKLRERRLQAGRAYWKYISNRTNDSWNRFVRVHVKSGGLSNINRAAARRMYN